VFGVGDNRLCNFLFRQIFYFGDSFDDFPDIRRLVTFASVWGWRYIRRISIGKYLNRAVALKKIRRFGKSK